jgi:uncharacterized membrane protein
MTGRWIGRLGLGLMTVGALLNGLYSLRYAGILGDLWPRMDPKLQSMVEQYPVRAVCHMLIAPLALMLGPLQFIPTLRARRPRLHRYVGRVYVAACLIAGTAALATALHASGGPIASVGFSLLAVCWLATTAAAWQAAVRRRFPLHRLLMRFSYAMTFGAVTLRLQIPLGVLLGYTSYAAMSVWLAYTAWIPNVFIVALYTYLERRRENRAALAR